jgi:hypothetical protein
MSFKFLIKIVSFSICVIVFSILLNISISGDDVEFKPITIDTKKLTITGMGGGNEQPSASFIPVVITTKTLTITGKGGGNEQPSPFFIPVVITTKKLTITGK